MMREFFGKPFIVILAGVVLLFFIGFATKCHAQEKQAIVTGAVAVNYDFSPSSGVAKIVEVRIHLSAAGGAGDLTITLDSQLGTPYDVVYLTQGMATVTDIVWQPPIPVYVVSGDALEFDWANANTRTYGIEILYR